MNSIVSLGTYNSGTVFIGKDLVKKYIVKECYIHTL